MKKTRHKLPVWVTPKLWGQYLRYTRTGLGHYHPCTEGVRRFREKHRIARGQRVKLTSLRRMVRADYAGANYIILSCTVVAGLVRWLREGRPHA